MRNLTMGSLFDGSGGFPLSAALCGITPVWASEIEPYPIAVTRSRFPEMLHLGSVTEVCGGTIPPVDIITFGSPCQDMSVAGKRAGMKHETNGDDETTRSGLFYEAVRVIQEMRDATDGRYPTIAVWENVPGAFSSNRGEDFRCVLEELAKVTGGGCAIPRPTDGRWRPAGEILGDGFSIAWRTLDAQYWGVPQRRRRIYLVADFGGERAGEILFERNGLQGHPAESGEAREEAAGNAGGSAAGSGGAVYAINDKATRYQGCGAGRRDDGASNGLCVSNDGKMCTLDTACRHAVAFMAGNGAKAWDVGAVDDGTPTLKASPSGLNQVPTVVYPAIARTLTAEADASPCVDRGQNIVVQPSVYHTLTAANARNVESAQQPNCVAIDCRNLKANPELSATLQAKSGGGYSLNYVNPICYSQKKFGEYVKGVGTLTTDAGESRTGGNIVCYDCRGYGNGRVAQALAGNHEERVSDYSNVLCMEHGQANAEIAENLSPTLNCDHEQPIACYDSIPPRKYIVRRLTPLECCRLQGFPDGWGEIDHKENMTEEETAFWESVRKAHATVTGKAYKPFGDGPALVRWYNGLHTDSAEYKMWGNGIALPCALYVMQGIQRKLEV